MTSLSNGEQNENSFLLHERPRANLQQSENSNGIKPNQRILSASSSLTSTTLPNQPQQPYRSLSSHNLTSSLQQIPCSSSNDIDSVVNQFERRLDEHRLFWQKEYDRKIQQIFEIKTNEFSGLKVRYETKLNELEENNRQLEILSGQINEENKRLKIEIEHEKQQNKIEQTTTQQHLKEMENELERKIHEIKHFYENEKQEIKRQHSRMYQDFLEETNQRLKKMENDYKYQQSTNESIVDEMAKRLVDLRSNVDHLQQIKQKLNQEKIQLIKNNEQLQLQERIETFLFKKRERESTVQELTNKQRHIDRDHIDGNHRYENELKSVRVRCESSVDLLRKENDVLKSKSSKTIDDLENKLSRITENFHDIQKSFEQKFNEQQMNYQNNMKLSGNDSEKQIQLLKQELKESNNQYHLAIQHNEQLINQLKQQKDQIQIDYENQIQEIHNKKRENEQELIDKLQIEYEQAKQQNQEKLRQNLNKEIEEIKHKYEQATEQIKNDLQQINKLSMETKFTHDNDKQKLVNEYEQFIRKLEKQYLQKTNEYEKRIETFISKTHEQLKSMEDDFEVRNTKQQSIINDQQKMIEALKDEQNKAQRFHEKQYNILNEQALYEKNEIKAQFDVCMKNLEKNFKTLTLKKEQLERKLSYLNEQHKHEMIECRLSYENKMKGLLTNDVRLDLENTIQSLKQQVVYLQQRIAFLQQELEQYVQIYGHRPLSQT